MKTAPFKSISNLVRASQISTTVPFSSPIVHCRSWRAPAREACFLRCVPSFLRLMNSTSASSARCVHARRHDAHLSPEVLLAGRLVSVGRRTVAEILYDKLHRAPPEPEGGLEYVSTTGSVDLGRRGVHTSGGSLNRNPFYLILPEPSSSTLAALPGAAAWEIQERQAAQCGLNAANWSSQFRMVGDWDPLNPPLSRKLPTAGLRRYSARTLVRIATVYYRWCNHECEADTIGTGPNRFSEHPRDSGRISCTGRFQFANCAQ